MKRLRESEAQSPLMEKAHALLDAVPPLPESRERMLRVRRELDRPRGLLAGLHRAPALVLAALVVLFGASAFAAVRYLAARPEHDAADAQAQSAAGAKRAQRGGKHPLQQAAPLPDPAAAPVPVPAPEPVQAIPEQVPTAGAQPLESSANAAAHGSAGAAGKPTGHTAPRVEVRAHAGDAEHAHPSETERVHASDSELVHRAVKALRRDGDPALAARLLDENRKRYPDGPLAEEALSLQIEAALALHDVRARAFAREYSARYPGGRYIGIAQRALEGAVP